MEKGIKSKRNLAISIGVLTIVAVVIFLFSETYAWIIDDVRYQFNLATSGYCLQNETLERIESVWDIFASQWEHYFTVNGRYVAHWFVQLYCGLLGQTAFAISNALVYVAFIILLVKFVGRSLYDVSSLVTVALLLLLMCDTLYGPAYQIGFVWTFATTILWLYMFFRSTAKSVWACCGLFLFSVLAGNGQEALNIGISGALIIHAIANRKTMTPGQWAMFFGFGLGALAVCLSPATIGRIEEDSVTFFISMQKLFTYPKVSYILLIVLLVAKYRRRISLKAFYKENSFYFNAFFILLVFNVLIEVYGNRQLFGMELMALILTVKCLYSFRIKTKWLVMLTIIVSAIYVAKWHYINHVRTYHDDIVKLYRQSEDGAVYYDLCFAESRHFCQPTFAFMGRMSEYEFLEKLLRSEGYDKALRIYPACLGAFKGVTEVENQVVEFDDGCFVVIQSKAHPAKFILKREINVFVYRHPFRDYVFTWDKPFVETDAYKANVIYEEIPFIDNIKVEIQK